MKKRILISTLCLSALCAACSNASGTGNANNNPIAESQKPASDSKKNSVADDNPSRTADSDPDKANESAESDNLSNDIIETEEISIGDSIKTDDLKIRIKNVEFSHDVLPDDTSSFYTHYPADEGKVYIHIDTNIKNKQKHDIRCDSIMSVTADYNDGYTYNSQPVPEDSSTGFTYANITSIDPLETLGVHYLIDVPEEVETSDKPLFLTFKVKEKEYKYIVR